MTPAKPSMSTDTDNSTNSDGTDTKDFFNDILPSTTNYLILIGSSIVGFVLLIAITLSFFKPFDGPDVPNCKGVYMSPAYAKVHAFDSTHTRFASKYSLYLYREQGKDSMPGESSEFYLSGTPVLFIPGNAGSYKQVRSIAAETATQFFDKSSYVTSQNSNANKVDFFTADFNEDFTAFHGRTMLDQSEYLNDAVKFILSLYDSNSSNTSPTSVILLGHSMGGIVARVMLSLPNYLEGSVNTIITLSTPHNAAPTTFDGDLLNVYKLTDDFWRNGFSHDVSTLSTKMATIARRRLENVSLISITGGVLDTTLPTDYTSLTGLVPSNHGFSVSTTGIPGVWTPIDHLAIVWCDQLRKVLAKTILQIIDVNSPSQTYPLEKRMEIFKSNLLPGFDKFLDIMKYTNIQHNLPFKLKIDLKQLKDSINERFFQLPRKNAKRDIAGFPPIHLFNIPRKESSKFNFISSIKPTMIDKITSSVELSLLLCRSILSDVGKASAKRNFRKVFDYTTDITQQYAELECIDVSEYIYVVPKSYSSNNEHSNEPTDVYYSLEIPSNILSYFSSIVIVEPKTILTESSENFVLADLHSESSSALTLGDSSLWKLITRGNDLTIPAHRPIIIDINVPSMKSSLLAYRLDVRYAKSSNEKFSPLISQTIKGETKWHINIDDDKIITSIINGDSPYTPFIVDDPESHTRFKVFSDSFSSDQLMDIYITVDWFQSLKLLVLKYRLSVVGFPLFFTLLVITLQFRYYSKTNLYPSFGETMLSVCDYRVVTGLVIFFSFLSKLTSSNSLFNKFIEFMDPVERNELHLMEKIENAEVRLNVSFMSIEEPSLWFYGVFVLFISIGLNFLLYNLILLVIKCLIYLSELGLLQGITSNIHSFPNQRKTIGIITLLFLVLLYLPYQFAFVVCVLTQLFSTLKLFLSNTKLNSYHTSYKNFDDYKGKKDSVPDNESNEKAVVSNKALYFVDNFKNFNLSLLILMLWLVPINVPVLVVWLHDISLKWRTPFSSHHNILAILPIIYLVQALNQGFMVPRPTKRFNVFFTKVILFYFAFYCLFFGTRHLYLLHSLFDAICTWFLILYIQGWGNGSLENIRTITIIKNETKIH